MMTMHSAKGLEFPVVFVVGIEEGLFPGMKAIGEPEEMEEERRLCYVAMTRAKQRLYLTCASQRMLFGRTSANRPSRFTEEIPEQYLTRSGRAFLERDNTDPWSPGIPSRSSGYSGYQNPYRTGVSAPTTRTAQPSTRPAGGPSGAARYPLPGRTPVASSQPTKVSAPTLELRKGDMVNHKAFGKGMVTSTQKVGGDTMIEVAFDNVGTKRLMLKFAGAQMTKL